MKENESKQTTENAVLLKELVCAFVQSPQDIVVSSNENGSDETLTLHVPREDYARVYGKMGKNMASLQTIFDFIGHRDKREIVFILPEPPYPPGSRPGDARPPAFPFCPRKDWDAKPLLSLLDKVLRRILSAPAEAKAFGDESATQIRINPANDGDQRTAEAIAPYIDPIFSAIGRQQGRNLHLSVKRRIPT